jgi:hypothetical protein
MAHVSTMEQGAVTSASMQLSQEVRSGSIGPGVTFVSDWILTRGAPRIYVNSLQSAGADPGIVTIEASVSDDDAGARQAITIEQFVSPLNVPMNRPLNVPAKFVRVSITAPAGNAVTLTVAIMAAQ